MTMAHEVLAARSGRDHVRPGQLVVTDVDIATGTFENRSTGASLAGEPMPLMLRETISAGGTHALLRAEGYM